MVGILDLFPPRCLIHLRKGKTNSSLFFAMIPSCAFSLQTYISDASKFCSSSASATRMSPCKTPPASNAYPTKMPRKSFYQNGSTLQWSRFFSAVHAWPTTNAWENLCTKPGEASLDLMQKSDDILSSTQKSMSGPLDCSPNRRSYGVFPSDERPCTLRRKRRAMRR